MASSGAGSSAGLVARHRAGRGGGPQSHGTPPFSSPGFGRRVAAGPGPVRLSPGAPGLTASTGRYRPLQTRRATPCGRLLGIRPSECGTRARIHGWKGGVRCEMVQVGHTHNAVARTREQRILNLTMPLAFLIFTDLASFLLHTRHRCEKKLRSATHREALLTCALCAGSHGCRRFLSAERRVRAGGQRVDERQGARTRSFANASRASSPDVGVEDATPERASKCREIRPRVAQRTTDAP